MEKEFVSYKLAKALFEKGFDIPCLASYSQNGLNDKGEIIEKPTFHLHCDKFHTKAPLYQQVINWLNDKYGIWITVRKSNYHNGGVEYNDFIYLKGKNEEENITLGNEFDDYYKALENAIDESLKLI